MLIVQEYESIHGPSEQHDKYEKMAGRYVFSGNESNVSVSGDKTGVTLTRGTTEKNTVCDDNSIKIENMKDKLHTKDIDIQSNMSTKLQNITEELDKCKNSLQQALVDIENHQKYVSTIHMKRIF